MAGNDSVQNALSLINKDESKILGLKVGNHKVTPGKRIPKADAQSPPELSFEAKSGSFLAIGLDLDAPFVSFAVLGPILHWIQPGLKPQPGTSKLTSDTPFVADYIGLAPPLGSGPHRNIFLLYDQPADFDYTKYAQAGGKRMGAMGRMRYNLATFEKQAKLGPVLAANYFCS